MAEFAPEDVARALGDLLASSGDPEPSVHLPGLGRIAVEHRPSEMERGVNGKLEMTPPANRIVFHPDA